MITLRVPGAVIYGIAHEEYSILFPAFEPFGISYLEDGKVKFTTLCFLRRQGHTKVRLVLEDGEMELEYHDDDRQWHWVNR